MYKLRYSIFRFIFLKIALPIFPEGKAKTAFLVYIRLYTQHVNNAIAASKAKEVNPRHLRLLE
jgi:hypothetical protein